MRNPGPVCQTSACCLIMPKGLESEAYRSTEATVFSVAEGGGCSKVGNTTIDWQRRDTFVVPGWMQVRHYPAEDSFLFSFSNRLVQEKLGLWREFRREGEADCAVSRHSVCAKFEVRTRTNPQKTDQLPVHYFIGPAFRKLVGH